MFNTRKEFQYLTCEISYENEDDVYTKKKKTW